MARPATAQQLADLTQQDQAEEARALEDQTADEADGGASAALAAVLTAALAAWVLAFGALTTIGAGTALATYLMRVRRDIDRAQDGLGRRAGRVVEDVLEDAAHMGVRHAVAFARRATGDDDLHVPDADVARDALHAARGLADTVTEQLRLSARLLSPRMVRSWRDVVAGVAAARRAVGMVRSAVAWCIHRAINDGAAQAIAELGARALWVAEPDACVRCLAYSGTLANPDGQFPGGLSMDPATRTTSKAAIDGPPLHPNCFPAGTIASGPGVRAATDRWYEGEMVEVRTRSGRVLTVTPNHPVLTDQGWVAAGQLREGSQVVGDIALDRVLASDPDDYQQPARIEDVARTLGGSRGVMSVRVPVAAEDFHGDGADGEVDVVWADGLLGNRGHVAQPLGEKQLSRAGANLLALSGGRNPRAVLQRLRATAHRCMGGLGVGAMLLRCSAEAEESVGIGYAPDGHALLGEHSLDDSPGNPRAVRDALDALASLVTFDETRDVVDAARTDRHAVAAQEVVDRLTADPSTLGEGVEAFAGAVALDQVVGVTRFPWSGHVYNLETSGGWYTANGILVHNCRCRLVPWRSDWGSGLPELLREQALRAVAAGGGRPTESRAARRRAAQSLLQRRGLPPRLRHQAQATAAGRR